jgi:energy-coupling factor transporter ATP-binding protein EcfA2
MSAIEQITLSNVGPIEHLRIPFPAPGKIVVLHGRNGAGKSTALQSVESAMTGNGKVAVRDGAPSGSVEAFGVTLKLARSTRRSGELAVEALEGKFSISDLIDPGIIDPKAADARRIKAFAQIQKVLPAADLFYELVGGRENLEKLTRPTSLRSDDLVVMAERIKADLQESAKREEDQAVHAEGWATGARTAANGVDLKGCCDAAKLTAELNAAIREEARLKADADAAVKSQRATQLARDQLADAEAAYDGPTVAEATLAEDAAKADVDTTERDVRELESRLQIARQQAESARRAYSAAIATRKQAQSHETAMQRWREQVDTVQLVAPTPEQLAAAAQRVATCNTACEQGALIRKAKEQLAEADRHLHVAQGHRERAHELRDAAKGTDDVLSNIVQQSGSQLRVEGGRLVLDTERRGKTFFHELSAGERARIAIDIGIDAMPKTNRPGVIVISQEIFEGLDPVNRDALAAHIAERGVGILTAEAGEQDEITPEVYEPEVAHA